jgi:hypothetical protein
LNESQLELGLAEQKSTGRPLGMTLVRLGYLDEPTLIRALASQLKLPVVSLRGKRINAEILRLVPVATAEKFGCLPLLINGEGSEQVLYLGVEDATDAGVLAEIGAEVGMAVQPVLVGPTELDECIHRHYHWESTAIAAADPGFQSGPLAAKKPTGEVTEPRSLSGASDLFLMAEQPQDDEEVGFGEFLDMDLGVEADPDPDAEFEFQFEPEPEPELESDFEPEFETDSEAELSMPELAVEPEPEIPDILEFAEPPPETLLSAKSAVPSANDSMLRAIAQLLIEKGIFTRDELVDRLRTVAKEDP